VIPVWWSVVLTLVGVVGLYALTKKKWWGFAIGLSAQMLWLAYAVTTQQWGFLGSCVAYGTVNVIGLRSWLKNREADSV
jgi:nicotinamide riboside transporter PnuC